MKPLDLAPYFIIAFCIYFHIYINRTTDTSPTKSPIKREAFATLTTPAFCMGAVVLGYSLQLHHGDKYDRLCLVTPDVNETWREILNQWWTVIPVKNYKPGLEYRRSWAKLHLWELTNYSKLVYLDTDLLILRPIDALFNYSQFSCVPDTDPPQICNTGVFVLEPERGMFEKMVSASHDPSMKCNVGDQPFLNAFFRTFTPIPSSYNVPRKSGTSLEWHMKENLTHIVHYVCKKPWKCGRSGVSYCGCGLFELNSEWFRRWDEACKDHKCMETWVE